jgi:ABC-type multidrug transport system ATPase subunit
MENYVTAFRSSQCGGKEADCDCHSPFDGASFLYMDEPSAGWIHAARRNLINLLKELRQTMIIATHDLLSGERCGPCAWCIIDQGRVAAMEQHPSY